MSSIDLVILGMVLERPQSAYDLQKDVEFHHFSRWTRISIPSIYKKVIQLRDKGYLESRAVKGGRAADKAVYSITPAGRAYFDELMSRHAAAPVSLPLDFNVVIANLDRLEPARALSLAQTLRETLAGSAAATAAQATSYGRLPLTAQAIFDQQQALYQALLDWLDDFLRRYQDAYAP